MAAASRGLTPEIVHLRQLGAEELEPVLEEQQLAWRSVLLWDFAASAELVRRFLRIHALSGYAARVDGQIVGYAYYVCEERKGLIGDLFLLREFDTLENEDLLLSAVLHDLMAAPYLKRIEAQLMMMKGPFERQMPLSAFAHVYPRILMLADLANLNELPQGQAANSVRLAPWEEGRHDEAALLIASAYQGHIDASINDQYRSYSGAKRFLSNIVQYPGCGSFFTPGSIYAEDSSGKLCGMVLSSLVAGDVGHITQICVAPEWKGRGVGYELLRNSLVQLAGNGCDRTSLTVTASNGGAIGLYQRMGFRATRRFAAYVWDGF